MNTLTINIDLATTPVDAVAEVLRILNGNPAPVAAPKKESKKAVESGRPAAPEETKTSEEDVPGYFDSMKDSDVRAIANAKRAAVGAEKLRELIKKHGADSITQLDPSVYRDFIKDVNAL